MTFIFCSKVAKCFVFFVNFLFELIKNVFKYVFGLIKTYVFTGIEKDLENYYNHGLVCFTVASVFKINFFKTN